VEYDKQSNLLNSPLMKTLNIAFFPLRFETKVATIMAKSLGKTSLLTQVSVLNGLFRAPQFLNSPEGQAWYSRNSDAISFFEYITPTAELNQVFSSLLPGHDHSLGNFGELGGLPFGWIPLILDAEGITHLNQPTVSASTGQIIPEYVPATTKGQMAIALQDFLSSVFTYPGSELGMPSKAGITRSIGLGLVGGNKKTDLSLQTPSADTLSMQQQSFSAAVQNSQQQTPQNQQEFTQPNSSNSATTVPATTSTPSGKVGASAPKAKKLKKGQYIPAALPGQTTLGQE
jgi:hypothetical protein